MASLLVPPLPSTERGQTCSLNVDPSGKKWIYCSGNNIVVRSIASPTETFVYRDHAAQKTTTCSFSPNGNWVASADISGLVKIWGTKGEHTLKAEFRVWAGAVLDLAWSPDSQRIVAVGDGKELRAKAFLFDTGNSIGEITGHSKRVNSAAFRPIRPFRAATGGEDFIVCLHEGPPFKFARSMQKHTNYVNCVRFSPDGETLASGSSDSSIHLYEGKTGEYETTFEGIGGSVWGIEWSANGQLASVSGDKTIRIWEKGTATAIKEVKIGDNLDDMPLGISWGAGPLTAVCLNGNMVYFSEDQLTTVYGTQGTIHSIAYSKGSEAFFYGSADGYLCRLRDSEEVPSARIKVGLRVVQVIGSYHSQIAVITGDEKIHFVDANSMEIVSTHALGGFAINGCYCGESVLVLTKKNAVISVSTQGVAWTRQLKKPVLCFAATHEVNAVTAVAYEGVGNELTIQTAVRPIEVYDDQGEVKHTIDGHKANVTCMAFSPDGAFLATCDADRKVFVWRCDDWIMAAMWGVHTSKITCVTWNADSRRLATGGVDRTVCVFNAMKSEERDQKLDAHKDGVYSVAWGDKLASVGADGCLKLW